MVQHREVAVVIMTWPMSLESQFSSMRLREADITGSVVNIFKILLMPLEHIVAHRAGFLGGVIRPQETEVI